MAIIEPQFNYEDTRDYPLNVSYNWIISCLRNIEKREKYYDNLFQGTENVSIDQLSQASRLTNDYIKELIISNGNVRFTYHPPTRVSRRFSNSMLGRYDIIYCALIDGRFPTRNHSTRGTLEITSEFAHNTNDGMYHEVVKGTIQMPKSIEQLGVLSNGGTFSFTEKKRSHLVYIKKSDRLENLSAIPMINIATHNPNGDVSNTNLNDVNGMIKRFSQKTAISLCNNVQDDEVEDDIDRKMAITREHYERTCSWLVKYTKLPIEVTRMIGSYLRPPPFFFFERDDLCIETMSHNGGNSTVGYNHFFVARRVKEE